MEFLPKWLNMSRKFVLMRYDFLILDIDLDYLKDGHQKPTPHIDDVVAGHIPFPVNLTYKLPTIPLSESSPLVSPF